MGWDNSTQRQSVRDFLLDLMGIDPDQLLEEALHLKMEEAGLTSEVQLRAGREEGDGMYDVFTSDVIKLSDGRVFIETQTETTQGDDWGNDYYSFVETGKPFVYARTIYDGSEDEPHVSTEEMISTYGLPDPVTPAMTHHPECNDITRCHPDCLYGCSLAQERAAEDTVVSTAHIVLKPEVVFGPEGKKFSAVEVRDQGGVFGEFVADYMEDHGLDHISFATGDEEDV